MTPATKERGGKERVLRLRYPCYIRTEKGKIGIACVTRRGHVKEAFLDPLRVKKVVLAVERGVKRNAILLRSDGSVIEVLGNYRIEGGVVVSDYGYKLHDDYVKAWIGALVHYVVYQSDNNYYDDLEHQMPDEVIKEGGLELLSDVSRRVKPCRGGWRVHLGEFGWDKYCFPLPRAIEIAATNVHPIYGVLD